MTDLGDILERALGGNTLNKLLAQGLKTLLCCSRHNCEAMGDFKGGLIIIKNEFNGLEEQLQLRQLCSYNSSSAFPTMSAMRRAEAPGLRQGYSRL